MNKFNSGFFLLMIVLLLSASCRSTDIRGAREDFYEFYEHFLTDSSFQMERVQFPLPGHLYGEEEDSTYTWTRENWVMLKKPNLEGTEFERRLQVKGDTLATDEIFMENSGFYFKMVYEPVKRKWHLVYLVDSGM
jgi:hypothetical protein